MVSCPCLLLVGPTAVGKSEVALLLAEHLKGEIISVDSMQVYRGLDIGTAKPSFADQARIPHHLIDVVDLNESFDAGKFVELARKAAAEIRARGALPMLCGGTGLYFKAFLEGLGSGPAADSALRAELEKTPIVDLLAELARKDAVTHAKIAHRNPRRVIRALEVIRLTGKPLSDQRAEWGRMGGETRAAAPVLGLYRSREDLRRRIDQRVDEMFHRGLVAETERLLERGLANNRTALQALGYRQVAEHLHGTRPLDQTIELVKIRTGQFAKRQMTWFRHQLEVSWFPAAPKDSAAELAARILRELGDPN